MTKKGKCKYIKAGNRFIKNDLKSLLLYYDYFSVGLPISKKIGNQLVKKVLHKLFIMVIYLSYFSKIYLLKSEIVESDENFIIKLTGEGKGGNEIVLKGEKSELFVFKKFQSKKDYEKEKSFYEKHSQSSSRIKLPKHVFLEDFVVKIEFIKAKTFQKTISEGSCSYEKMLEIFLDISRELTKFYSNEKKEYLIHGDLGLTNIFANFDKTSYYIIDYGDSFSSDLNYDRYVLLRSILTSFGKISRDASILKEFPNLELAGYEKLYMERRLEKHPEIYG